MFQDRLNAFATAQDLVDPIIEKHGLNKYTHQPIFGSVSSVTYTEVDQHVDTIIKVADWLLEKE